MEKKRHILFYYDNYCGESSRGGTEVATARIAGALVATGRWSAFHAFLHGTPAADEGLYENASKFRKATLERTLSGYLNENNIDVIVNMGRFFRQDVLKKAALKSGRDVKLLFMHHFAPGSEMIKPTYRSGLHLLGLCPQNPLYWLRATLYPVVKLPRTLRWKGLYNKVWQLSDGIILLSEGYEEEYRRIAGITGESQKFHAIPNIFECPADSIHSEKEKRVLILSRMDEIQKRITLALDIWAKVEASGKFTDWHLDIVGDGHDMKAIKSKARTSGLKNVTFHGWKDSQDFLRRSSILISTSAYEGLSLSMIEALAYGCVPIAFDCYASLRDIITDGETGIRVKEDGSADSFSRKLMQLMSDVSARRNMAAAGRKSTDRFSPGEVASKWETMLERILNS